MVFQLFHKIYILKGYVKRLNTPVLPLQTMLTEEEKEFIVYWEENRLKSKKIARNLSLGLPLAALLVITIFFNFFSGWYKKADMVRNKVQQQNEASLILVLIAACILIVVFVTVFSVRHKWEKHEQRYLELMARRDEP